MNIAYYSHYFKPEIGAPSARIFDLSKQWIDLGHNVQVVTCFPNHPTGEVYPGYRSGTYMHETLDGIDVHRHWTYITPNKGFAKTSLGHLSFAVGAQLFSKRKLQRPGVAIGSSPTFFAAGAARRLARKFHIPFVMEVRDLWPAIFVELGVITNPRIIKLLEMWEMSLYRHAARVVTVTDSFRTRLIERGVPAGKVETIYNGADTDFWIPAKGSGELRNRLGLDGKFVVLYIGAHGISHALGRIIEAADMMKERSDIRFVFVGEGAEKEDLVRKAQESGLTNVQFLDPVSRDVVRAYYAMADVCLVPLRNIPLFNTFIPSKMFEMMAMGKPIVASVRGEPAEILRESGSAIVVEPEDSAAIARSVQDLQCYTRKLAAMGANGRRFVLERFSRKSLAEKYLGVLAEAIKEHAKKTIA
jgi:glycosyltransferase involved in cell wall biosynthesis